ncbi:hypothetical protein EG68_02221 [Paragonimus skrjabini miyazakii]|uniref:Uncharacterized protein n=1 Tax=Paragonimus skrjabini miyazakii TaxID=59628 RepID=A0A8S9YZL1_9TREM|nr:hypothetical protein EG68_02221 [Paragonimus skrjabini miyazakii]
MMDLAENPETTAIIEEAHVGPSKIMSLSYGVDAVKEDSICKAEEIVQLELYMAYCIKVCGQLKIAVNLSHLALFT